MATARNNYICIYIFMEIILGRNILGHTYDFMIIDLVNEIHTIKDKILAFILNSHEVIEPYFDSS